MGLLYQQAQEQTGHSQVWMLPYSGHHNLSLTQLTFTPLKGKVEAVSKPPDNRYWFVFNLDTDFLNTVSHL